MSETMLAVLEFPDLDELFSMARLFLASSLLAGCCVGSMRLLSPGGFFSGRWVQKNVVMLREKMDWNLGRVRQGTLAVVSCLFLANGAWANDYSDGMQFYQDKDYEQAFSSFKKAADKGNAAAQSALAALYYNGEGVEEDEAAAALWYSRAAEHGVTDAQFALGEMFEAGEGVKRDAKKAAFWYKKAADKGHLMAATKLGILYMDGRGVKRDDAKAARIAFSCRQTGCRSGANESRCFVCQRTRG